MSLVLQVGQYCEHWMQFTMQVCAFAWELFVLPLWKVSTSKREKLLSLQHLRLAMNYVLKLHSVPENPTKDCVVNPKFVSHFQAQPRITPTLGIHLQPHFQPAGIEVEGISRDSLLSDIFLVCTCCEI